MKFGTKLKMLRTMRSLDQEGMSKLLNVSQPVYSRYESNEKAAKANDSFIKRVAAEFKVEQQWLLNDDANVSIVFEKGSIGSGATGMIGEIENYYSVPKDFMDAFLKQQEMLEKLLEKLVHP